MENNKDFKRWAPDAKFQDAVNNVVAYLPKEDRLNNVISLDDYRKKKTKVKKIKS